MYDIDFGKKFHAIFKGKRETSNGVSLQPGNVYELELIAQGANGWLWFSIAPISHKKDDMLSWVMNPLTFVMRKLCETRATEIPYGSVNAFLSNWSPLTRN